MKQLDEIIDLASSDSGSISTLLRKCLVLASILKSDQLMSWARRELNGYELDDESVPEYRKIPAGAKGFFISRGGGTIDNQPIPSAMLKPEHRAFAETAALLQPIASYEGQSRDGILEWPANLTGFYEKVFFSGSYALNRAWQEIPASTITGLVDTVKTRVLMFALELRRELEPVDDDISRLPASRIAENITLNIFGGTVLVGTHVEKIEIAPGDWTGLAAALGKIGVPQPEVDKLHAAVKEDAKEGGSSGLGKRTKEWLGEFGKDAGKMVLSVGFDTAKVEIIKWLHAYLGVHGG